MTEIKICGIRSPSEAAYLNEYHVQYAGFVLYEKSKRHVTTEQAGEIMSGLSPGIKKVAVTVSPDETLIQKVGESGFDILQIHGDFNEALLQKKRPDLKVWRALNVTDGHELLEFWEKTESSDAGGVENKIYDGVLLDAKNFGSGKTFGWETISVARTEETAQPVAQNTAPERGKGIGNEAAAYGAQNAPQSLTAQIQLFRQRLKAREIRFILAGGLNAGNVAEGIRLFSPDVVDVSSGVEAEQKRAQGGAPDKVSDYTQGKAVGAGKSRKKIEEFVAAVENAANR